MGFSASIALTVASMAMQAYSAHQQGEAQAAEARYKADYAAKMAARNQSIVSQQIADQQNVSQIEEKQMRLKTEQTIGQARSDLSGSGVVLDTGSPLEVTQDVAAWGEWDVQQHRWDTAKKIWSMETEAASNSAASQAYVGLQNMAASNASSAGIWGAGGSLLSGGATVADKWYTYSKMG